MMNPTRAERSRFSRLVFRIRRRLPLARAHALGDGVLLAERLETEVINFKVWNPDDPAGEEYWVCAETHEKAREAIACTRKLAAPDATDRAKFDCVPDEKTMPPLGFIHGLRHGIVAIGAR